ncbi:hypothetical protein DYB37_005385 [Aphanomyces astaci]|uniref:Uncharacterized protein n=1 Tax=Aphanomyces astaci TaxID=112090 RepID=A0A3R7BNT1_APHAT|nr:hypothetical protein DYB35_003481 [Aphanomyces astaci]RHZ34397.1 hypothetical protein DYB37_005385 [Aphanomyces astaci]
MIRRLQPIHAINRPRMCLFSKESATFQAIRYYRDYALQLQTLPQQKVRDPPRVASGRGAMYEYTHRDIKAALARTVTTASVPSMKLAQRSEEGGKFWLVVATLAWTCATMASEVSIAKNDGWTEKKSMRETSIPAMEWHEAAEEVHDATVAVEARAVGDPRQRNALGSRLAMWALQHLHAQAHEPLTTLYEHVTDIHME